MHLTEEQQNVVDTVCSSDYKHKYIAVNAVAGSGKTSTANAVINAYKPKNGFYTAFNRAIVKDSSKKFGDLVQAKTIHALAYANIKPKKQIRDLNYTDITEKISYEDKALLIASIDEFFRSSFISIEDYIASVPDLANRKDIGELAYQYADMMLNGKIAPTFNYLLKCFHIMLAEDQLDVNFDLLILDECQDTTAVTLEIFKHIKADRKLILGDRYQNIYSFMRTINAFDELDDLFLLKLTKSFRCNEYVASIVEDYGKQYLEEDFSFTGTDVPKNDFPSIAYLTRSNAALVERIAELTAMKKAFSLTRNINEVFALPIALLNASNGKPVYDSRYAFLQKEYANYLMNAKNYVSFFDYLIRIVKDTAVVNTCAMLMNFRIKNINLYDLKDQIRLYEDKKSKTIVTTTHAFKGLEADFVVIEDDLNNTVNRVIRKIIDSGQYSLSSARSLLDADEKEDLNTYYVALSRARQLISNVQYLRRTN